LTQQNNYGIISHINRKENMSENKIKATNPYSGQSEMLTRDEYIVYTMVKKFEEMEEYDLMQEGLTKFSKMNPKAYMTLLD
tara:strand:+ start:402 stop:644 length:243 start_codon:yes stop_codon:yes gene_type:complete